MEKKKTWRARKLGLGLAIFLLLFALAPYLIPVSAPAAATGIMPFANSAYETVNGISIHYRVYIPEGPVIKGKLLFIHGLAGSTFSFEEAAPRIAGQGYYAVSVDLPGFGYSGRDAGYDHSQANRAKDIWKLLEALDGRLPDSLAGLPWNLAGHSMGGGTVAAMAIRNENRTESLIFIDAALFDTPRGGILADIPPLNRWMKVALEHFVINESAIKRFLASAYGTEPTPGQVEGYLAPLRLPGTAGAFLDNIRTSGNEDAGRLRDLTVSILAVWGARDTWVPLDTLEKLKAVRPDISVSIIDGAAHCPMETHTDIFVETVVRWLDPAGV